MTDSWECWDSCPGYLGNIIDMMVDIVVHRLIRIGKMEVNIFIHSNPEEGICEHVSDVADMVHSDVCSTTVMLQYLIGQVYVLLCGLYKVFL